MSVRYTKEFGTNQELYECALDNTFAQGTPADSGRSVQIRVGQIKLVYFARHPTEGIVHPPPRELFRGYRGNCSAFSKP